MRGDDDQCLWQKERIIAVCDLPASWQPHNNRISQQHPNQQRYSINTLKTSSIINFNFYNKWYSSLGISVKHTLFSSYFTNPIHFSHWDLELRTKGWRCLPFSLQNDDITMCSMHRTEQCSLMMA